MPQVPDLAESKHRTVSTMSASTCTPTSSCSSVCSFPAASPVAGDRTAGCSAELPAVGAFAEALSPSSVWRKVKVLNQRVTFNGPELLVHYQGFSSEHDEWVGPARIRPFQEKEKRTRTRKMKVETPPAEANEMTLMVRHLPLHYSPTELLQEVEAFLPNIDFFYLPTNFESKNNLGYAFLNFDDKAAAQRFEEFWLASGISEGNDPADPEDEIVQISRVQGWAANVERFRNSSVMEVLPEENKPRIWKSGMALPFPSADKARPVGPRFRPTQA